MEGTERPEGLPVLSPSTKETLITAITHYLPYMGFPRTLNALGCINAVIPEQNS